MFSGSGYEEEARAFLQKRVALVGGVVCLIASAGIIAQATVWPVDRRTLPAFAWLTAGAICPALQWLICRSGQRHRHVLRIAETLGLLGTAVCASVAGGFVVATIMQIDYGAMANPIELSTLHVATQFHIVASVCMGLGFAVVLRAALVPSPPEYTAAFTAAMGVPLVVTASLDPALFGWLAPLPLDAMPSGAKAWHAALVWWVFATTVCFTIAKVIYGLRQEVARAQQLGQYTLEAKLGEGGMGVVYRARHAMLQRPTAVKLIDPEHNSDAQLARFEREVQLTTRLTHPNTITIYDYGRTLDGVFYYAMELLDGVTLEDVVDVDGAQPPERVVRILRQVAGALGEAHALGLIHRDIKPGNIMLCTRGGTEDVAKLLDFGLVKQVGGGGAPTVTAETKLIGTPMYMSPEAVMAPEAMDGRSDLYALGAVGYYLLTGDHVFKGATAAEVCGHHLHSRPPPPSERLPGGLPGTLDRLVLRCLAKRPDDRPQSAHELLALLEDCGGSDAWTQTRAAAWWTTHRGALRSCAHVDPIEQRAFSARLRAPNQRGHTF